MKNVLTAVLTVIVFLPLLSFGQQRWETIISDEDYSSVWNSLSYDGSQLIIASTGDVGSTVNIIYKIDKNGEILWEKHLVYDNWTVPSGIIQSNNGETVVYGETGGKATVALFDACNNLVWCHQYFDSTYYTETFYTYAIIYQDKIVLSISYVKNQYLYDIGLVCFDLEGNFLWDHPFNMLQKYPEIASMILCPYIFDFENNLILSGYGYYSYPGSSISFLKPMFVKTDSDFNEEWLLTYGLTDISTNDTILGEARGVVSYKNGILHGWGSSTKPWEGYYNSNLMNFDTAGNETSFFITENQMLDSTTTENFFLDVATRDDTSYFTSIKYGNQGWKNPSGEVIIDTMGNVYQHNSHAGLQGGFLPLERDTVRNQYYLAYENFDWDIVLYKLNADLSDAGTDTTTYNYDSLCDNLPIVSDTIYIGNCDVITTVSGISFAKSLPRGKAKVGVNSLSQPGRRQSKL